MRKDSRWARGFDWDAAHFEWSLIGNSLSWDWLRIPSDQQDALQNDLWINPKTLVKTLLFPFAQTGPIPPGEGGTCYIGLIAWDYPSQLQPVAQDVPQARFGSYDWLFWLPMNYVNGTGGTGWTYSMNFQQASDSGGLQSSAQRKLPPGKGLLWVVDFDAPATHEISGFCSVRMGLKGDVTAAGLGGG